MKNTSDSSNAINNISVSQLSLPKGGGAIQGIGEKLQVQEFTGSGSFTLPIFTSPCREISPELAVNYSSSSGNGTFGLGWNLNLPKISRKTTKAIPLYSENDTYLLSDSEDLVPLTDKTRQEVLNSLNYDVIVYAVRNEGSFSLIEHWQPIGNLRYSASFWKVTTRDHMVSIFGFTPQARTVDPDDNNRIFAWLLEETYNAKGDHQLLFYKQEYNIGVPNKIYEQNRSKPANRYIERICYGYDKSVAESIVLDITKTIDLGQPHFELVFDYGEYDISPENTNSYIPAKSWEYREDAFSSYNSGFEIRTFRRCLHTLMFHRFSELGEKPVLTHATKYRYEYNFACISELKGATGIGYKYEPTIDKYSIQALPEAEFGYSDIKPKANCFLPLTGKEEEMLSGFNESKNYNFVDLFGEGISGIFYNDGRSTYYRTPIIEPKGDSLYNPSREVAPLYKSLKNNISENALALEQHVKYGPWQQLENFPIVKDLAASNATLTDIAGNGHLSLVVTSPYMQGYWQVNQDQTWENFQTFKSFPLAYNESGISFADMNGTGLSDLVQIRNQDILIYPSLGKEGFDDPVTITNNNNIPTLLNTSLTEDVRFTSIDGSGRPHLVEIKNGRISYWPNLGYGRFGKEVIMGNSPSFDQDFDIRRLFIVDIDGTGTGDIVYFYHDKAVIYFNRNGNEFGDSIEISLPVAFDNNVQVSFADITGRGTTCLVLSDSKPTTEGRARHWYYDFCQGQKPYLINSSTNNMGARVEIEYGSSVDFYLSDKKAGISWITNVPFPVHVVTKVTHIDEISQSRYVSSYAYRHGYYDGEEKEFRGFGRVDRQDGEHFEDVPIGETEYTAPSLTRSWYHVGAWIKGQDLSKLYISEYYQEDKEAFTLPDNVIDWQGIIPDEETKRLAYVAFAGTLLHSELYGIDEKDQKQQHPYSVTENNYQLRLLQAKGDNKYPVWQLNPRESISYSYERDPSDPQIHHQFTLEIDEYGNSILSATVAYARRSASFEEIKKRLLEDLKLENLTEAILQKLLETINQQNSVKITCSVQDYYNNANAEEYLLGVPVESKSYEVTGVDPQDRAFDFDKLKDVALKTRASNNNLLNWERLYYADTAKEKAKQTLPFKQVILPLLLAEHHVAEFTGNQVEAVFTEVLAREELGSKLQAGYYNLDKNTGYWWNPGLRQQYNKSESFYLPSSTVDPGGNTTSYEYDKYNLLSIKTIDALGNKTEVLDIDYRYLHPRKIQDINDNISEVMLDPVGQVIYTSFYGSEEGKAIGFSPLDKILPIAPVNIEEIISNPAKYIQEAASFFYYDLFTWQNRQKPIEVVNLIAENYPAKDKESNIQIGIVYSDGFSRTIENKAKVENDNDHKWLTSGVTIYDNKGNPIKQYEPYYSDSYKYDNDLEAKKHGNPTITYYDPLDRTCTTVLPAGFLQKHVWTPWQEQIFDANDAILKSPYYNYNVSPAPDPKYAIYADANLDRVGGSSNLDYIIQYFSQTPATNILDNLGRTIITQQIRKLPDNVQEYPSGEILSTYSIYDITGNLLSTSDPRLNQSNINNYEMIYSLTGKAIKTISVDAGISYNLTNIFGNNIYSRNGRSVVTTTQYDQLHRPSCIHVQRTPKDQDSEPLFKINSTTERFIYGDTQEAIDKPKDHNLRGKLYLHYDQAGQVMLPSYSITGGVLINQRRFLKDYKNGVDWSDITASKVEELLEDNSKTYVQTISYDGIGKVIEEVDIDKNITKPKHNLLGQLKTLEVTTNDDRQIKSYIEDITYNAKGQREQINYDNKTNTTYSYDAKTWAVTCIITKNQTGKELQNLNYLYDPAGNVVTKLDRAQDTVFYKNQQIDPVSDYSYDSLYQLIEFKGRQQLAKGVQIDNSAEELSNLIPGLNNLQALENYIERYSYDQGGNLTNIDRNGKKSSVIVVSNKSNRAVISSIDGDERIPDPTSIDDKYFDKAGNQKKTESLAKLSWDYHNNLSKAVFIERETGKNDAEYYVYDNAGNRVIKRSEVYVNDQKIINIKETRYLGSVEIKRTLQADSQIQAPNKELEPKVTEEYHSLRIMDDTTCIATRHCWSIGWDKDKYKNPTIFYHLTDNLGSNTTEVNERGEIVSIEEYSPYGNSTLVANIGNADDLKTRRYSGKEKDATGFYYYGARYYQPNIGRWLSADPAGPVDGLNIYAFVGGNPVSFVDVGGGMKFWIGGGVGLLSGVAAAASGFGGIAVVVGVIGTAIIGTKLYFDNKSSNDTTVPTSTSSSGESVGTTPALIPTITSTRGTDMSESVGTTPIVVETAKYRDMNEINNKFNDTIIKMKSAKAYFENIQKYRDKNIMPEGNKHNFINSKHYENREGYLSGSGTEYYEESKCGNFERLIKRSSTGKDYFTIGGTHRSSAPWYVFNNLGDKVWKKYDTTTKSMTPITEYTNAFNDLNNPVSEKELDNLWNATYTQGKTKNQKVAQACNHPDIKNVFKGYIETYNKNTIISKPTYLTKNRYKYDS